jgi:hypothetical protein
MLEPHMRLINICSPITLRSTCAIFIRTNCSSTTSSPEAGMCMYSLPPLEESHCFVVTKLFLWERETLLVLRLSGESDREDNEVETLLDDSDSFMGSKTRDQTRTEPIILCNTAKQRTLQIKDALGEDMEGHRLPRHKDNVTKLSSSTTALHSKRAVSGPSRRENTRCASKGVKVPTLQQCNGFVVFYSVEFFPFYVSYNTEILCSYLRLSWCLSI